MNQKHNLEIEILTPIHIGNGNTISGMDYFCLQSKLEEIEYSDDGTEIKNNSYLYKFKMDDLKEKVLDEKDRIKLNEAIEIGDTLDIRNLVFNLLSKNKSYQDGLRKIAKNKVPIKNTFYKLWKEKIKCKSKQVKGRNTQRRENEFTNQLSQLQVGEFINSMGRYYIPGSSLKGAIRTVLTDLKTEKTQAKEDPFKKLIVRDSKFTDKIIIGKLARQSNKGEGQYAEFIESGEKLNTEIVFKGFMKEINTNIKFSKEEIIEKANKYISQKIEKYILELKKMKNHPDLMTNDLGSKMKLQKIESVMESFNTILDKIVQLNSNEFVLNLGFGGGYWFKLLKDLEEKHPKFCSNHGNWEPDKGCNLRNQRCNILPGMQVKNLKDNKIQIPRTNWTTDLQNLGFIKCKFID